MRSTTTIFVVLLILSCEMLALGSHSVLLYSQKRFRGRSTSVEMNKDGCYRLGDKVGSISTEANCVRLYVGRNCFGASFDVYRRCNIDLGRCNVSRKIESMCLC